MTCEVQLEEVEVIGNPAANLGDVDLDLAVLFSERPGQFPPKPPGGDVRGRSRP